MIFGFGFRISGHGFRVFGSGFGFRVSDFGFRVPRHTAPTTACCSPDPGFGFWVSGPRSRVLGVGFRLSGSGFRFPDSGVRVVRVPGCGIPVSTSRCIVARLLSIHSYLSSRSLSGFQMFYLRKRCNQANIRLSPGTVTIWNCLINLGVEEIWRMLYNNLAYACVCEQTVMRDRVHS